MLPGDCEDDELAEAEKETHINDEIVEHPTRDDWHEQREYDQTREAVLAAHSTIITIEVVRKTSRL